MKKNIKRLVSVTMLVIALSACQSSANNTDEKNTDIKPNNEITDQADSNVISAEELEAEKTSLTNILDDIADNMEVGTAGSSLKSVAYAKKLMDWSMDTMLDADTVKSVVQDWVNALDTEKIFEHEEQLTLLSDTLSVLMTDDGRAYMDDAGFDSESYSWADVKNDLLTAIVDGIKMDNDDIQSSDNNADDDWKATFEKSLMDNYGAEVDHYEELGDGLYQVYVNVDGNVVPYVTVNSNTGEYHG